MGLRVAVCQPQRAEVVDQIGQHRLQPFAAGMIERLIHQAHQLLHLIGAQTLEAGLQVDGEVLAGDGFRG